MYFFAKFLYDLFKYKGGNMSNKQELSWKKQFKELKEYAKTHGTATVPYGHKLYEWCNRQRHARVRGKLKSERKKKLDNLGFEWEAKILEKKWNRKFLKLKKYREKNGHCNVPIKHELSRWVDYQRERYSREIIRTDRKERLESIGFEWERKTSVERRWYLKYIALKEYINEHGDCLIPKKHPLGAWVKSQREARKNGNMPKKRQELLDKVGFVWNVSDVIWQNNFDQLLVYYEEEGDLLVPSRHPLGRWVCYQRKKYKDGTMDPDRLRKLDEIGFVWDASDYRVGNKKK
ncbi:MAG: hypothetical protein GF349_00580 [Candidatus Magasanikbacteria bacterium]|nr:hypothetical protein [Candidatus Magasanikbacteria bacterium]